MQVLWRECEKYFDFNGESIKNSQFDAASFDVFCVAIYAGEIMQVLL